MTLEELYNKLGLKGQDRCGEGVVGQHLLNVKRAEKAEARAERLTALEAAALATAKRNWDAEQKWSEQLVSAQVELLKRPWIDGGIIPQGEHEADIGQIGYTIEAHQILLKAAKEEQREACAVFIEQARGTGLVAASPRAAHAERCRAAPLVK